jgi:hypothetical protein
MTRRGDPEKIYQAQRSGIFRRLVDAERLDRLDAEHWIARWEREAEATGREGGSTGFWDDGWRWKACVRASERGQADIGHASTDDREPEEEWLRRSGRPMTAAELERVMRRYPGDI